MKQTVYLFIFLCVVRFSGISQTFQWAKSMGGLGYDGAKGLAVDVSGNLYTIGVFENEANFDPGNTNFSITSTGLTHFISKHDPMGNFLWTKYLVDVVMSDILIDPNGRVVICGYYTNNADLDTGPGVFNIPTSSGSSCFVLKLDSNGNFIWAKSFSDGSVTPYDMATDNSSNLYFCGLYYSASVPPDFDPGIGTYNLSGSGSYILKLDSSGNFILAKSLGNIVTSSLAVDPLQNIVTTGYFTGTNDFDPGIGTFTLATTGPSQPSFHRDIFISKLDQNGNFVWAKKPSCFYGDQANSIATDGSGNVYITGYFNIGGNTGFDIDLDYPAIGQHTLSSVSTWADSFVAKYDAFGNAVWGKNLGSSGSFDDGYALALDPSENIYVLGKFSGSLGFDLVFVLKMNSSGSILFFGDIGVSFEMPYHCLAVDYSQQIYIAGSCGSTSDLDPETGVVYANNAGGLDAFVLKLNTPFVGVKEKTSEKEILDIYPNPNNGSFTIKSEMELYLNLTNSFGQIVKAVELNRANNYEFKTEILSSGLYFLSGVGKYQSVKQKIVVTK
jgi:hypothetical protein